MGSPITTGFRSSVVSWLNDLKRPSRRGCGIALRGAVTAGGVGIAALPIAPAGAQDAARVDIAIHQLVLPNGDTRYFVPVSVGGGAPIDASVDTGSFGLRVLAGALTSSQYEATDMQRRYPFSGGARFNGPLAKGQIEVGDAKAAAPQLFQIIQSVDCTPQKPHCPASLLDAKTYRIAGDGYAGIGFEAIIGISMRKAAGAVGADNPIAGMGDGRWIVILPKPGQSAPGHLIVNPSPDDAAGFNLFHLEPQAEGGGEGTEVPGWRDAALAGCLINQTSKQRLCGRTLFDSGAQGLSVDTPSVSAPTAWPDGTAVRLELSGGDQPVDMAFTVGQGPGTKVHIVPGQKGGERVSAGTLPFFSFAVLYDQKNGLMGLKARNDP